jgi:hypothetical protein
MVETSGLREIAESEAAHHDEHPNRLETEHLDADENRAGCARERSAVSFSLCLKKCE